MILFSLNNQIYAYSPYDFTLPTIDYSKLDYQLGIRGNHYFSKTRSSFNLETELKFLKYHEDESLIFSLENNSYLKNQFYKSVYDDGTFHSDKYKSLREGLDTRFQLYPLQSLNLFFELQNSFSYSYSTKEEYHDPKENSTSFRTQIGIGVGFGKIRDVNTYYKALRVMKMLKKYFKIKSKIPKNVLLKLAKLIYRKSEYKVIYEEKTHHNKSSPYGSQEEYWLKYYYHDMQKILMKIPELKPYLNFFILAKIQETIDQYFPDRKLGFAFSCLYNRYYQYTSSYDQREYNGFLNIIFDSAFPLSDSLHCSLNSDVFYRYDQDQYWIFKIGAKITYEFSNNLYISTTYRYYLRGYNELFTEPENSSHQLKVAVSYIINKNLSWIIELFYEDERHYNLNSRNLNYNSKLEWRIF